MNFIRSDQQVALNNLLVAVRESVDHYRDAAGLLEEKNICALLNDITNERSAFIGRLEQAIRASGDLPTMPDPDKETGEILMHHLAAFLKSQYADKILEQRIEAEKNLASLVIDGKTAGLDESHTILISELDDHVAHTIDKLQAAYKLLPNDSE